MKPTLLALAAVLALSGGAFAHAATFSPPSSGSIVFEGPVTVMQSDVALECTGRAIIQTSALDANGDNRAAIALFSLAGGLCALNYLQGTPYEIVVVLPAPPPDGVTAQRVKFVGLQWTGLTNCGPSDVEALWDASALQFVITPATVFPSCNMSGQLTQVSGPILTITN